MHNTLINSYLHNIFQNILRGRQLLKTWNNFFLRSMAIYWVNIANSRLPPGANFHYKDAIMTKSNYARWYSLLIRLSRNQVKITSSCTEALDLWFFFFFFFRKSSGMDGRALVYTFYLILPGTGCIDFWHQIRPNAEGRESLDVGNGPINCRSTIATHTLC